ncbi:hypothetical protein HPDFL43_01905 [Hoeflea phototrophica DFL-43]|jgi:hypothetical protein|uniref:Uncharacterized protein n=1 Tax=Hoeflea phototrophica (strain DSM 17068 / NCIMB 14078 / DFL-43) TaxID=411684 RepID=A9D029_HOEPD|nr:hypothetical protein HPDFL43_01905 [Hoeflea phototrophica DFL-43]
MHRSPYAPRSRYSHRGMQIQFYRIYFTSLFCLIAMGWAAALIL